MAQDPVTANPSTRKLPESTTVLIVGGGPVGLTSAIAFARYGMESVILERHATKLGQPKAHVINHRSVEIFRQYGVDLAPLRALGLSDEEAGAVIFASSMNGLEYGVIKSSVGNAAAREVSPQMMFNVAQPLLEERLLQAALKTGKVTYLPMHEWKHCTEDATTKEITSAVLLRETNATRSIASRYLIACDGTNASSRDILQIPFETLNGGPEVVLHYASVHFSSDLSHFKPGLLWFILNPTGMGVFIAYNRKNSWVFTIQYEPSVTPMATFTSEVLKAQVFKAIGAPLDDYKELGITLWKTSPKIAASYRSKTVPHAFLAGDAAHSFPPTGGLGMNTGIGDIHNLAWKIYAVEKGWASDSYLDTVTPERWAVANDNSKQSKINEDNIYRLVSAIFKPGMTTDELWADEICRKEIQDAIQHQRDHFDSINLVLGYVYGRDHIRGPSDYRMENVPGARLPHGWVETGTNGRISTLDLVDGYEFVLLTSPGFTTERRVEIQGVPVSVVQLERDFTDPSGVWTRVLGLNQDAAVLVRPDQHIVGSVRSMEKVSDLLTGYWNSAQT
ncbi:uncharacterized protein A1O9_08536 [Exophiala aquamarina CBS 119918]|uniref:FAD-binding domain-containing protein n=1 Tax=Exophiala aquamarina CBS 119918 TaxID=1182545 RepID=A0A072PJY2_9EURO|nr:uncharacterized protein A1O9_08536 [Exophiala aquamarina CBS 119918]KEF55785.1 hypothetical protein A1O9_08536 [Exophiala aquamarina CBS 119918]